MLDEAARLFEARGYHDTTTNHVADAAGVSIGSIYQYFPNKDALIVGLADRHLDQATPALLALAERLRREQPDAEHLAREFVRTAADLNDSDRLHGLLWAAPRTPALTARVDALDELLVDEVIWHLERLGHRAADTRRRARLLVTVVDAAIHALRLDDDREAQLDELTAIVSMTIASP